MEPRASPRMAGRARAQAHVEHHGSEESRASSFFSIASSIHLDRGSSPLTASTRSMRSTRYFIVTFFRPSGLRPAPSRRPPWLLFFLVISLLCSACHRLVVAGHLHPTPLGRFGYQYSSPRRRSIAIARSLITAVSVISTVSSASAREASSSGSYRCFRGRAMGASSPSSCSRSSAVRWPAARSMSSGRIRALIVVPSASARLAIAAWSADGIRRRIVASFGGGMWPRVPRSLAPRRELTPATTGLGQPGRPSGQRRRPRRPCASWRR